VTSLKFKLERKTQYKLMTNALLWCSPLAWDWDISGPLATPVYHLPFDGYNVHRIIVQDNHVCSRAIGGILYVFIQDLSASSSRPSGKVIIRHRFMYPMNSPNRKRNSILVWQMKNNPTMPIFFGCASIVNPKLRVCIFQTVGLCSTSERQWSSVLLLFSRTIF